MTGRRLGRRHLVQRPAYGIISDYDGHKTESEQDGGFVFRLEPDSANSKSAATTLFARTDWLSHPMSADCISSTPPEPTSRRPRHIRVFDISPAWRLGNLRRLAVVEPGVPNGFRELPKATSEPAPGYPAMPWTAVCSATSMCWRR
ncbi:hypothetical protein V5738_05350 [Salinisphaera sp. SPP-AMP-43]|uniref:hypothetical protein n=1 Tax=Salinisphaera sp. SPP-AMP-43 TaxID=3121288 RepID=UPI003C6EA29E